MSAHGSAATEDDSKKASPLGGVGTAGLAVLAAGAVGGVLLSISVAATVIEIRVGQVVRAHLTGRDRHGWALLVLGLAAAGLSWAAGPGGSRAALAAVGLVGAAVLAIWGIGDLPHVHDTGQFGIAYEQASAAAGPGFWIEPAGGVCLIATAVAGLARRSRR